LLGRAIVLVRDDQLSLAIGRRGQNVRLASKLVGWDIEIMTAEELDEVIEKAVKAFERIEAVDVELAERLVEQGILSFDDLSVMEISDLVNTIEGLTEEQAVQIVARAETLAEAQTEELPRRKGARAIAEEPSPEVSSLESSGEDREPTELELATRALLSPDEEFPPSSDTEYEPASSAESYEPGGVEFTGEERSDSESYEDRPDLENYEDRPDPEHDEKGDDEIHDLALAVESSAYSPQGHEVTFPPSENDQGETIRIVTEAVEPGRQDKPSVPPHGSAPKSGAAPRSSGTSPADVPPDHPAGEASGQTGETP
jgi:N utilization substance protein A